MEIIKAMEAAHTGHRGAVGLSVNGRDEMIDAPMLKQVRILVPLRNLLPIVNAAFIIVIGATNHLARKGSRVTHPILQLINVNVEMSINKANEAKC